MKNKAWMTIVTVLVVGSLAISIYNLCGEKKNDDPIYYTLYVGTNDKDTYQLEMPLEEAVNKVDVICNKYLDGVTLSMATGSWADETGTVTHENTIEVIIYDADLGDIYRICDEIIKELNQNSILIAEGRANVLFYSGKDRE